MESLGCRDDFRALEFNGFAAPNFGVWVFGPGDLDNEEGEEVTEAEGEAFPVEC